MLVDERAVQSWLEQVGGETWVTDQTLCNSDYGWNTEYSILTTIWIKLAPTAALSRMLIYFKLLLLALVAYFF